MGTRTATVRPRYSMRPVMAFEVGVMFMIFSFLHPPVDCILIAVYHHPLVDARNHAVVSRNFSRWMKVEVRRNQKSPSQNHVVSRTFWTGLGHAKTERQWFAISAVQKSNNAAWLWAGV